MVNPDMEDDDLLQNPLDDIMTRLAMGEPVSEEEQVLFDAACQSDWGLVAEYKRLKGTIEFLRELL